MNLLNIIDKIYGSSYFTTFLIGAIILLIVLFIIVLIMGIRDSKKINQVVEEEEEPTDITLKPLDELEKDEIKEDVTFEIPSITANLENFKKNLELELQKNNKVETLNNSDKQFKVTQVNELEDTVLLNPTDLVNASENEEVKKVEVEKILPEEPLAEAEINQIAEEEQVFISPEAIIQPKAPEITVAEEEAKKESELKEKTIKRNLLDEDRYEEIRKIYLSQTSSTPKEAKKEFDETLELPSLKDWK